MKYLKKHFLGKNIDEAMYETSTSIILELSAIMTKVSILIDCLCVLRKDKEYFSQLGSDCQTRVKSNIVGLKIIRKSLHEILLPISQGLNEV